jgi:hypothetical protein
MRQNLRSTVHGGMNDRLLACLAVLTLSLGCEGPLENGGDVTSTTLAATAVPAAKIAWRQTGFPAYAARIAACGDGTLWALNVDRAIFRNAGSGADNAWTYITTLPQAQDIACSYRLWAFNDDHTLLRNEASGTAMNWMVVGRPTNVRQITVGWNVPGQTGDAVFGLQDDGAIVRSPTGADGSWTKIGTATNAKQIAAGRTGLWLFTTGLDLLRGNGSDAGWTLVDHPSGAGMIVEAPSPFQSGAGALWALNWDKKLYFGDVVPTTPAPPSTGILWERRGLLSQTAKIAGCPDGSLYALNYDKTIWRNTQGGVDGAWALAGSDAHAQDITCGTRLWVSRDDRTLLRNDGGTGPLLLTRVGRPASAKQVTAGWGLLGITGSTLVAYQDDNNIFASRDGSGSDGSWVLIGSHSDPGARIIAGRSAIWTLHTNKDLLRGNGQAESWKLIDHPWDAVEISDDGSTATGSLWALNSDHSLWHGRVAGGRTGLEYHGGPVMGGASRVYYTFYGDFTADDRQALIDLASNLSGGVMGLASYYPDSAGHVPSSVLSFGGSMDDHYSRGKNLTEADQLALVKESIAKRPGDPAGIYILLVAADVAMTNYCTSFCGRHSYTSALGGLESGGFRQLFDAKYAIVGHPGGRCPTCLPNLASSTETPNGKAVDGMASTLLHEILETVSDPHLDAWYNTSAQNETEENADICENSQLESKGRTADGRVYNLTLGTRNFFVRNIWVNDGSGRCALSP